MIVVNRIGENILVSCRGKEFNVMYTQEKFEELCTIATASEKVKAMPELEKLLLKVEGICKNNFKEKVESFCPDLFVQPITQKFYLKLGKKVSSIPLPGRLVRRIQESMDKGVPVTPIIKTWKRFLRNPQAKDADFARRFCEYIDMTYVRPDVLKKIQEEDNVCRDIAIQLATTYEVKITQEGLLACFKISKEIEHKFIADEDGNPKQVNRYTKTFNPDTGEITGDNRSDIKAEDRLFLPALQGYNGDAFFCEGPSGQKEAAHFIRIGHLHRLPSWSNVNCDSNSSCVKGLHCGGLSYISGWEGDIHTCLVDPAHIGAIPNYNNSYAIRVLQYYVDGSLTALNHSIYHSSEYGKLCDASWKETAEEIIKNFGELSETLVEQVEELKAL